METTSTMKKGRPRGKAVTYPWGLNHKEMIRLFQSAPREFDLSKNIEAGREGKKPEYIFVEMFAEAGLADKVGLRRFHLDNPQEGNKLSYHKFRYLVTVLLQHPSLVTKEMREEIEKSQFLSDFMNNQKYVKVELPVSGQEVEVLEEKRPLSPLANQQEAKMRILAQVLDKTEAVLSHMSEHKIRTSGMGTLSKSLSDLVKTYTMMKDGMPSQNFIQYNIKNLNLTQKKELSQQMGTQDGQ